MPDVTYPIATVVARPQKGPITVLVGDSEFEVPVTDEELELAVPAEKLVLTLDSSGYRVANSIIQQDFRKTELKKRLEAEKEAKAKAEEAERARIGRRMDLIDSYFEIFDMVRVAAPGDLTLDLVKDIATHLHIEAMRKNR